MKLFSEYLGHTIEIVTPSCFKSEFNLVANGLPICTLKSTNFWCTRFEINGFGKAWEVYCASVWKGKTEIKEKDKELPIASYEGNGLKHSGTFILPQGERVALVFNLWKSFYELKNEKGEVLLHYANKSFFCSTVVVTMNKKCELLDKYPFLIMVPFHIAQQRNHAAAAVTH
jgi:hypothetical protein